MGSQSDISAAGRRRVEAALETRGLLLVQGQAEIPSVADLLAGAPVTTRGYSWDYAPAWRLTDEYASGSAVAVVKLFRGRRTLVHRALWAPVHEVAHHARAAVVAGGASDAHARFVATVEAHPATSLGRLRDLLAFDRRTFDRVRRDLDQWLCVLARERDDVEYHTHEPALSPWSDGVIAMSAAGSPAGDRTVALATLRRSTDAAADVPTTRLFPAGKWCEQA